MLIATLSGRLWSQCLDEALKNGPKESFVIRSAAVQSDLSGAGVGDYCKPLFVAHTEKTGRVDRRAEGGKPFIFIRKFRRRPTACLFAFLGGAGRCASPNRPGAKRGALHGDCGSSTSAHFVDLLWSRQRASLGSRVACQVGHLLGTSSLTSSLSHPHHSLPRPLPSLTCRFYNPPQSLLTQYHLVFLVSASFAASSSSFAHLPLVSSSA